MSRNRRRFLPSLSDQFESRIVPTVTATGQIPFTPPGQDGAYVQSSLNIQVDYDRPIVGDVLHFRVTGGVNAAGVDARNAKVTLGVYRSNGHDDRDGGNIAMQRLVTSVVVQLVNGSGEAYIDASQLRLTGQRDFQVDAFVNTADPSREFAAPDRITQNGNREYASGNFLVGWMFNYDTEGPNGHTRR